MAAKTALDRLKRTWWFAWLAVVGLALTHLEDVVNGIDRLLVEVNLKDDALDLANASEEVEFSRGLTQAAWKRLFWARAYVGREDLGAPQPAVEAAWQQYIAASEAWATNIMVYFVTTSKFYGPDKSRELEDIVQPAIKSMENAIIDVRYRHGDLATAIKSAGAAIDAANARLYHFVRGFEQKKSQ